VAVVLCLGLPLGLKRFGFVEFLLRSGVISIVQKYRLSRGLVLLQDKLPELRGLKVGESVDLPKLLTPPSPYPVLSDGRNNRDLCLDKIGRLD